MNLGIQSKKVKIFGIVALVAAIAVPAVSALLPTDTKADRVDGEPMYEIMPIHTVTRNDGGGAYGTHEKASYEENGIQYFRDGDIIEVTISLPAEHGSIAFQDCVNYDKSKVTLLSGYYDIRSTLARNYIDATWSTQVSALNNDPEHILVYGTTADYTQGGEFGGGILAKMYFRVLPGVETAEGTAITFNFSQFQTAGYSNGARVYTHAGYDANRDAETAYFIPAPITVTAKTPGNGGGEEPKSVAPTLDISESNVAIFEGDLFDPSAYIKSAACESDATIDASSVVISEGTGTFTKHQPVAGSYVFKYTVTNDAGDTTEKTLTLAVAARTYSVKSIDTASKTIVLDAGTSSAKLEERINALKGEDFDVTIECNDGSTFVVPGKVLSGTTDTYRVDENDNLLAQTFNVNFKLALPMISYDTDGNRVVTPYNGNPSFASNVGTGTADVTVAVSITGDGDNSNQGGNTNKPSADNTDNTAGGTKKPSTAAGGGTDTGDTTNVPLLIFTALLAAGAMITLKIKKQ